jgi:hypothetical protein
MKRFILLSVLCSAFSFAYAADTTAQPMGPEKGPMGRQDKVQSHQRLHSGKDSGPLYNKYRAKMPKSTPKSAEK